MMPFTRGLNQVDDSPITDSSWRSRMVTIGSAYEHVRPAGVLPTAPNLLVMGLPWIGLPFASTFRQTVVLNPRSSIRVRGIDLNGPVSLKPSSNPPGPPVRSGVGA